MYICTIRLRFDSVPRHSIIPDEDLEMMSFDFCHALNEILHEEELEFRGCTIGFNKKEVE